MSVTNSLASLYPELAKEWCTEKNGLSAKQIVAGSAEKFWWKCKKGQDHYWQAVVSQRAAGSGCPCCANQKLSVTNSLASKCPELAQEWNYKLNAISPSLFEFSNTDPLNCVCQALVGLPQTSKSRPASRR